MKKILIIALFYVCISAPLLSQQLSQEEKDSIITLISHKNIWEWGVPLEALVKVEKYQLTDALPIIEDNYWSCNDFVQFYSLKILQKFKSTKFRTIAHQTIDSADINKVRRKDNIINPLRLQLQATYYLIKDGDYSKCSYVFSSDARSVMPLYYIEMVVRILENVPSYREKCKSVLINVIHTDSSYFDPENSLEALVNTFGTEIFPELVWTFESQPGDGRVRMAALDYLITLRYPGLSPLLQQRLVSHVATVYSDVYLKVLLNEFCSPSVYSFIDTYQKQHANSYEKTLINFLFRDFLPSKPDSLITMNQLIDSLESCLSQVYSYNWIGDQSFVTELNGHLVISHNNLNAGNQIDFARQIKTFQQAIDKEYRDSTNATPAFVMLAGWKFLYYNAQYIIDRLPQIPPDPGCNVKLVNSIGIKLTGGTLQYYEGSWKDAVNNNDGTFFVGTTKTSLSLRMTYEYGTQTKSNVTIGSDTVVFQTVNAQIQLQNSSGILIDTGLVQYYAGAWRVLGTTTNGIAAKELLPANYSFRMTYAYAGKDKQQDLSASPVVVFQTVNAAVQLQNSQGSLIDQGIVQYYSGAWRTFGTTTNGAVSKELLANNYSFRMIYAYTSKDKQQDLGTNATVVFQTVNVVVQLKNSLGNLMPVPLGDQGAVQYYSGAWRTFGTTANGVTVKELLPNNYSFRMTYDYVSLDKSQDISTNSTVSFSTVLCTIKVNNSQSQPLDNAMASYYSGAWRQIGKTVNGQITKELLPVNLSFRIKYGTQQQDKQQNLASNSIVEFSIP